MRLRRDSRSPERDWLDRGREISRFVPAFPHENEMQEGPTCDGTLPHSSFPAGDRYHMLDPRNLLFLRRTATPGHRWSRIGFTARDTLICPWSKNTILYYRKGNGSLRGSHETGEVRSYVRTLCRSIPLCW